MSDRITLVKGKKTRTVNALEYRLWKSDPQGWEEQQPAPEVPEEVKTAIENKTRKPNKK